MGRWNHVVIVVEENHSYSKIIGNSSAPYLNQLAHSGASFTQSYADNLGHQLRAAGYTFAGYSEGLPYTGDPVCRQGAYARKHVPWTNFPNLPGSVSQPLSRMPSDLTTLPSVSFVIPNLDHDMHDGTVAAGDTWLRSHLGTYASWAPPHRSLLIVTWHEDAHCQSNRIPTIAVGSGVTAGPASERITHYSVLRTIENAFRLAPLGAAANAKGIVELGV